MKATFVTYVKEGIQNSTYFSFRANSSLEMQYVEDRIRGRGEEEEGRRGRKCGRRGGKS
jgi:hypothetical protein